MATRRWSSHGPTISRCLTRISLSGDSHINLLTDITVDLNFVLQRSTKLTDAGQSGPLTIDSVNQSYVARSRPEN